MNQYMLMFSLGPVQPFIEQARKTRDLWLGSYLLSKLMEAAMMNIEELGGEFVFPSYQKVDEEYANLPNKYIAIFASSAVAEEAAGKSREEIYRYWNTLRADVWNETVQWCAHTGTEEIWERQSNPEACFEIRWVVVAGDPNKYNEWLKRTEEVLDARKQLHNFQQREEPGEKSTISGERQALCWSSNGFVPERWQVIDFWKTLATRQDHPDPEHNPSLSAKEISLDGSERLDAIDTIKRFSTQSELIGKRSFPSTSSIATASFVEGLLSSNLDRAGLQAWLTATRGALRDIPDAATEAIPLLATKVEKTRPDREILRRDGDCYFRATFTPLRLEKDYGIDKENARTRAKEGESGLERLLRVADGAGILRPTTYYAVLKMDGDQMGKLLGSAGSLPGHKKLSDALSEFTHTIVPNLVHNNYPGRLVYAGGDDVLALAPLARNLPKDSTDWSDMLKTVIDLAHQLQQDYRARINRALEYQQWDATASISIAIAHHYAPLSFVLGVLRRAERQLAKKRYDRNALVVSVIRRSGAQTQVGCRWKYETLQDADIQPIKLFSRFYDFFKQEVLSPKCAHILLEEAPVLVGLELDAQISEIRRVLLRQRNDSKKSMLSDKNAEELARHLAQLAKAMDDEHGFTNKSIRLENDEPHHGLVEVLGWLLVMVFLTRKERD
jgi:CRISPR-associated protein Cmr2